MQYTKLFFITHFKCFGYFDCEEDVNCPIAKECFKKMLSDFEQFLKNKKVI